MGFKEEFYAKDAYAQLLGIVLLEVQDGYASVSMEIKPEHKNGADMAHGGVIFSLADFAFAAASNSHGSLALGISAHISFLKAATKTRLYAQAREISRNKKLATYDIRVTDEEGALIATFSGMVYIK